MYSLSVIYAQRNTGKMYVFSDAVRLTVKLIIPCVCDEQEKNKGESML